MAKSDQRKRVKLKVGIAAASISLLAGSACVERLHRRTNKFALGKSAKVVVVTGARSRAFYFRPRCNVAFGTGVSGFACNGLHQGL